MKKPLHRLFQTVSLSLTLLVAGTVTNGWGQEKVIIDTDFSQVDASHIPLCVKEPASEADFPLKLLTGNRPTVSVESPSSVVGGTEVKGGLKPPYALISIKPAPEGRKKAGFFASAGVTWKFQQPALGTGKYEATWSFATLTQVRKLRMAFFLMGETPEGKLEKIEPAADSKDIPLQLMISGGTITANDESVPLRMDQPNEVKMDFDLSRNSWSAEVNGKKLIRNKTFPKEYLAQFKKFWVAGFSIGGGGMEENNGAEYAVGPVKLVKLN